MIRLETSPCISYSPDRTLTRRVVNAQNLQREPHRRLFPAAHPHHALYRTRPHNRARRRRLLIVTFVAGGLLSAGIAVGAFGVVGADPDPRTSRPLAAIAQPIPAKGTAVIGLRDPEQERTPANAGAPASGIVSSSFKYVVVRPGDTLWGLAERYGDPDVPIQASVEQISCQNGLSRSPVLYPGRLLRVQE